MTKRSSESLKQVSIKEDICRFIYDLHGRNTCEHFMLDMHCTECPLSNEDIYKGKGDGNKTN